MVSNTLRPHQNASTHDRTKQFVYLGIAGLLAFSKSDDWVVPSIVQHVLCNRFQGNHAFLDKPLKLQKLLYFRK